jgi:hypothetical protein
MGWLSLSAHVYNGASEKPGVLRELNPGIADDGRLNTIEL